MTFLAPAMLGGLFLAAAPIIIHLYNRRRYRRVPWAAMDFLLSVTARSARRLKVEEMILLVLRTLAIVFLALAAARPFVTGAAGRGADAVILVDTSASMRYREATGTLLDVARSRVREIVEGLGDGSQVIVETFDTGTAFPGGSEPFTSAAGVMSALADARPGYAGTDYQAALASADAAAARFAERAAIFVVSDFRRGSAAAKMPPISSGPVYLVAVTDEDARNMGITRLAAAGEAFTSSRAQAALTLYSGAEGGGATVAVRVEADGLSPMTTPVRISASETTSTQIAVEALSQPGEHVLKAQIPGDALDADDTAYAVITRRTLRVAVAASGEASMFLGAAFSSAPAGAFQPSTGGAETIAAAPESFDGFVFAGGVPTGEAAERLWRRIREGGFAVVFTGGMDARLLGEFVSGAGVEGLDVSQAGRTYEGRMSVEASPGQGVTNLPAFGDAGTGSVSPTKVSDIAVMSSPGVETPLTVTTADGAKAFLTVARVGAGGLAIFNSAADRSTGDFVITPVFVPLLFETVGYLLTAGDVSLTCGREALLPVEAGKAAYDITTPSGVMPAEAVLRGDSAVVPFTPTEPGIYEVAGMKFAANVPAAESEGALENVRALERAFGATAIRGSDVATKVQRSMRGYEATAALVVLALAALAAEMLFVAWMKRR